MARRIYDRHAYAEAIERDFRKSMVARINAAATPELKAELERKLAEYEESKAQERKQEALLVGLPYPVALEVPFASKEAAKRLGAKWDKLNKKWVCPANKPLKLFSAWLPEYYKS